MFEQHVPCLIQQAVAYLLTIYKVLYFIQAFRHGTYGAYRQSHIFDVSFIFPQRHAGSQADDGYFSG